MYKSVNYQEENLPKGYPHKTDGPVLPAGDESCVSDSYSGRNYHHLIYLAPATAWSVEQGAISC